MEPNLLSKYLLQPVLENKQIIKFYERECTAIIEIIKLILAVKENFDTDYKTETLEVKKTLRQRFFIGMLVEWKVQ